VVGKAGEIVFVAAAAVQLTVRVVVGGVHVVPAVSYFNDVPHMANAVAGYRIADMVGGGLAVQQQIYGQGISLTHGVPVHKRAVSGEYLV